MQAQGIAHEKALETEYQRAYEVLGALWTATARHLGLSPKGVVNQDLKQILSGLTSIATGVAALRTHKLPGGHHGERKPLDRELERVGRQVRITLRRTGVAWPRSLLTMNKLWAWATSRLAKV